MNLDAINLEAMRLELEGIDEQLFGLFARRMEIVADATSYKLDRGIPAMDPVRERESMAAKALQTPPGLTKYTAEYFRTLLNLSRELQEALIKEAVEREMQEK